MRGIGKYWRYLASVVALLASTCVCSAGLWQLPGEAVYQAPFRSGLGAAQIGLIVNVRDPYSVEIGKYYQERRGIPAANVVYVSLPVAADINRSALLALRNKIYAALLPSVQALAVAWVNPSRVKCNSITSALAMGFVAAPCDTKAASCDLVATSPYYNSHSTQPYSDFGIRPAMLLAAPSIAAARQLIDRGIAADETYPDGSAYLMATSDRTRSLRASKFDSESQGHALSPYIDVRVMQADSITGERDVLFYFQGLAAVPGLTSNRFQPGAIADHLTSFGGRLTDSSQMSILSFIAAGATGSYGTVSEPCSHTEKFPDPAIAIARYTRGETLIEAYWKSVAQPYQGLFIGEPLANPWRWSEGGDELP